MAIFTFVEGGYNNQFKTAFYVELVYLPFRLAVVYTNFFLLLPTLLHKRNLTLYVGYTFLSIIIVTILHRILMFNILNDILYPSWNQGNFWQVFKLLQSFMIITSPMIFLIGFTIIGRWVTSERKAEMLRNEKTKAELNYLRSQINPHFFFNTLNNLYGLALNKSDKTAGVVMKLSELMSYILYEADREKVPLSREIEQIERYIALEHIRYEDRFKVDLRIEGDTDNCLIPPLILLPFVENCFKHGVNKTTKDGWITILISVNELALNVIIRNTTFRGKSNSTTSNGLGISNVKKRLELIFPNAHTLKYVEQDNIFTVELNIKMV